MTPKTKESKRKITIDDDLIKELKKHRARQSELRLRIPSWHKEDFIFTKVLKYPGYPETPKQIESKMSQIIKRNMDKKNNSTWIKTHSYNLTCSSRRKP